MVLENSRTTMPKPLNRSRKPDLKMRSVKHTYLSSPVIDALAAVILSRAMVSGSAKGALQKWIERPSLFERREIVN
jgi:hypothetical protein